MVFGSETQCPSCTCQSFQRTQLLCIHFCAVLRRALPAWTFDRVSPIYTQSPLLLLDEDLLTTPATAATTPGVSPAPGRGESAVKVERQKARSLLRGVFEMASRVDDVDVLRRLTQCLQPVHAEMSSVTQRAGSGGVKRKLPLRSLVPASSGKRRIATSVVTTGQAASTSGPANISASQVMEVHIVDGCDVEEEVTASASGPTFTIS